MLTMSPAEMLTMLPAELLQTPSQKPPVAQAATDLARNKPKDSEIDLVPARPALPQAAPPPTANYR
jgi:hypothetical protein